MVTRNGNIPAKVLKKSFYLNKIALIINGCIETIIFYDDLKLAKNPLNKYFPGDWALGYDSMKFRHFPNIS